MEGLHDLEQPVEPFMRYLTKDELAGVLRVSVRTITTYMSQGLLPQPLQLGRKLLWSEDTVTQFLQPRAVPMRRSAGPVRRGRPRKAMLG
jgi:predicted DNA-binding transcriptional regulator AlpA